MSLSYLNEKFSLAVRGMAISPEPRDVRLRSAWLQLHTLRADDISDPDLRQRFVGFWDELTLLNNSKAANEDRLARELCDLADAFHSLYFDSLPPANR